VEVTVLLVAAFCWASFDIARKVLVKTNPPEFVSLAFSVMVLPVYLLMGWYNFIVWPPIDYYLPASFSAVFAAVGAVSFVRALRQGKISVLIPVLAITPVLSIVFTQLLLDQSMPIAALALVLMMSFSLYRLLGSGGGLREPGSFSMLTCAASWSLCIVFDKAALDYTSPWFHGAWLNASVALLLGMYCMASGLAFRFTGKKSHWLFGAVCFLFAVLCQLIALKGLPPGVVEATKRAIGTVIGLALGVWYFSENVKREQLFHAVILLLSMACLLALYS
jgi:drug/metabolite transporter (DMT)-like permease